MEMNIKKPHNFFPKMFKVFSLYIVITLSVFFGYVQIFGNLAPSIITLPTDDTNADDESLFGNFVEKITNFKNIDTDFDLSFENKSMKFTAKGNVVYNTENKGLSLFVDLFYNQQTFDISAIYLDPNLYLTIDNNTYKFNTSGNMDLTGIIDFVSKSINMDLSFIDDLSKFLGIDLKNFDPNALLAKLKVDEKQLDNGGVEFIIGLGSAVSAQLICDKDYNIVSARVKDILIQGNLIKFKADVNNMNKEDIVVDYQETGSEIDMSGITDYVSYTQNLFSNDFVGSDLKLSIQGKEYTGKFLFDNTNGMKIRFKTNIEGIDAEISYCADNIYLEIAGLKFKFNIDDYDKWKEAINSIVEKESSKSVAVFVRGLIEKYVGIDLNNINISETLLNLLNNGFVNSEQISAYLPNSTEQTENSFSMLWNNGLKIDMLQDNAQLSKIFGIYQNYNIQADFFVEEQGFDIQGTYYDLSNLLPLTKVVDEILSTSQFSGIANVKFNSNEIKVKYIVDFENEIKIKLEMKVLGETINVFIVDNRILLSIGNIVVEGDLTNIESYLTKIDEIFATDLVSKLNSIKQTQPDTSNIINQVVSFLNNLKIAAEESKVAVISYLSSKVDLIVENNTAKIHFENGTIIVDADLKSSNEEIVVPVSTDDTVSLLNKIQNLKNYVEGKQFAFEFAVVYEKLNVSGLAQIDLKNNIFEISNVMVGGNLLSLRYENNFVYINYAGNKIKIGVDNIKAISNIVSGIVNANGIENNFDLSVVLTQIFGQDVSTLNVKELLNLISINLNGSLNELGLNVDFNSIKIVSGRLEIKFVEDMVDSINVETSGLTATLNIKSFVLNEIDDTEYYNFTSIQTGTVKFKYENATEKLEIDAKIEIDLSDKIYLNISTQMFDTKIQIIVLNNNLYITIGKISYATDFNNAKELYDYIIEVFEISFPANETNIVEILKSIDINSVNILSVENLVLNTTGSQICVGYKINENISLELVLNNDKELSAVVLPENCQDMKPLLSKIKNVKEYFEKGIFEFDFALDYNGLDFNGTFKYFDGTLEIGNMIVCGESVVIRLQEETIYFAFGNMKLKFDISNGKINTDAVNKLTLDTMGVVFDFGVFEELFNIYKTYTLQDYINNILFNLNGSSDEFVLNVSNKKEFTTSSILNAVLKFEQNQLNSIDIDIYDILKASLKIIKTDVSTITPFVPEDFYDYSTDYIDGLLSSLKVEANVYAFSSDIAIRYSNNQFYGDLVAMLVEDETYNGILGNYIPAISLYTTSLGLNSYIYLINETIYIDINGLQISADLNQVTIDEILGFVQDKLGIAVGGEVKTLEATTEMFKVILPAIDKVYGTWVTGWMSKGIQVNIDGNLWYNETSRFYDIVAQAFIQNYQNTIVPTKVILGANIEDPNTTSYDDYSKFWLTDGVDADGKPVVMEQDITKNLNFAVYLNNIKVGTYIKNLENIFLGGLQGYKNIVSVKSNYGTTRLVDFNSYKTMLNMAETVYDYAMGNQYGFTIDGTVKTETSTVEIKKSDIRVRLSTLQNGTTNKSGFEWLKDKSMKLEGELKIVVDNASTYMIDMMYGSGNSNDVYLTYAIAENNKFSAKIADSSINDIVILLQKIMGKGNEDLNGSISDIDKTLQSISDIVNIIKEINLSTYNNSFGQKETCLRIKIDIEDKGNFGYVEIIMTEVEPNVTLLSKILVKNIVIAGNIFNFNININNDVSDLFDYFAKNPENKHIDFSGASELIKALVNTSELKYYEVSGSLNINGDLIGIGINWNVPINIKVRIDENGKPEVIATIGAIPVVPGVNNDVPYVFGDTVSGIYAGLDRMLNIYYKDDALYIYRRERIPVFLSSDRIYEKKLKTSVGELLSNPLKYLQYGVGFSDSIMSAIEASLALGKGHTPQLDNVVKSFTANDNTNFQVVLNMKEISNDPKLDTMTVGLGVINTAETNNKNYIGKASFNMYMPLADAFKLTLDSNDLKLINIGKTLNFDSLYNYVSSYEYNEGAKWEASNGKWTLASEVKYNISFETNCDKAISNITQAPSTAISLPIMDTIVSDDGEKIVTRVFAGWYTTSNFEKGSEFKSSVMPRGDTKLYAKWNDSYQYYRTIKFETNSEIMIDSIRKLEGESIVVPTLTEKQETVGNTTTSSKFEGWYTDIGLTLEFDSKVMPSRNTTLYAKWVVTNVEHTYQLNVYDNKNLIYSKRVKSGETLDFSGIEKINENTKIYLDELYSVETNDFIMPENDLNLHIRNKYNIVVYSEYGTSGTFEYNLFQGESISLPAQQSYVIDDGNTSRATYTFNGYSENISVVPNQNITITANWTVDVKYYYSISFDLRWYLVYSCTAGSKMSSKPNPISSIRVLEGTIIDLTQEVYRPTCKAYLTAIPVDSKNWRATSWGTSAWDDYTKGGSGFTSYTVTGNQTLYACWERY